VSATEHEPFLGRDVRAGSLEERSRGTYRVVLEALAAGEWDRAHELLPLTVLEADELHDVYGSWPGQIVQWLLDQGCDPAEVAAGRQRVWDLVSGGVEPDFEGGWAAYVAATQEALALCEARDAAAAAAVVAARDAWMAPHDTAVDHIYGLLDLGVRLLGEECLPAVWDHLMGAWYDDHARRLDVANQPWSESARQLMVAILDGFHGHLSGVDRLGDLEVIEEEGRTGFRFAPCGSGGRVMRDDVPGGARPGTPYGFAVTTRPHDWSFGRAGVCGYCVHCCLLNMTMPIDRIGYPTRVIEPPLWPESRDGGTCTWWVYDDPGLVPDSVYEQVGRRRPAPTGEEGP